MAAAGSSLLLTHGRHTATTPSLPLSLPASAPPLAGPPSPALPPAVGVSPCAPAGARNGRARRRRRGGGPAMASPPRQQQGPGGT